MEVVIVYESLYGNTRRVAEAIAAGAAAAARPASVRLLNVTDAGPDDAADADLLIVGAPTHALRLPTPGSRNNAPAAAFPPPDPSLEVAPGSTLLWNAPVGAREWLATLHKAVPGARAAAFDTRLPNPLAGGAARPITRALRRHGYTLIAKPQGFVVKGSRGPLRSGEPERAQTWGGSLLAACTVGVR